MLKKIRVEELVVGMHLKEFCGSWMEHPFWRTGFVIVDPKDIDLVRKSSIKEVWIDASKGLDVPSDAPAITEAQSNAQAEVKLQRAAAQRREEKRDVAPVSTAVELVRAAKICAESKQAVISMFQEARMGKAVDNKAAQEMVEEISDSVSRNPGALISLARIKTADDYTYMHSVAVCAMMVNLAKQLGLDDLQTRLAGMAGLLHDLGKVMIPIAVLNKPGKLTDAEFTVIKTHPTEGHRLLLLNSQVDPIVLDACLYHHEKMDGSGYPKGLNRLLKYWHTKPASPPA